MAGDQPLASDAPLVDLEAEGYVTRVVRPRRASRLSARVDLALRLQGEPLSMKPIRLVGYTPRAYDWTRNAPATADTASVTLNAGDLPFDLRAIATRGGLIQGWLFEHRRPERCAIGDAGYFSGVIDRISRDRFATTITIEARDFTSFLLDTELTAEQLNGIDLASEATLIAIVRKIMTFAEGTETWDIRALTAAAELTLDAASRLTPPKIGPAVKPTRGAPKPAEIIASRQLHLSRLIADKKTNAWDAITDVCARFGVVPEVDVAPDGYGRISLIDAGDLQTSTVLRPFERGDRKWRLLVEGEDLSVLREELELSATDKRPDFVVVSSVDPETGKTFRACYPPGLDQERAKKKGEGGSKPTGLFQTIEGIRSVKHLERLARRSFESLAHNQFTVTVATARPWSNGGGAHDPDLLNAGYGAALELGFANFDKLQARPDVVLKKRLGVDDATANRIVAASDRIGASSLLFQITEVHHAWEGGNNPNYTCDITARQFLGSQALPIVGDVPRPPAAIGRSA